MRPSTVVKTEPCADRPQGRSEPALRASRVDELAQPTLGAEEPWQDLANDDFDPEAAALRGFHFTRLNQLALEHLMGVRA